MWHLRNVATKHTHNSLGDWFTQSLIKSASKKVSLSNILTFLKTLEVFKEKTLSYQLISY